MAIKYSFDTKGSFFKNLKQDVDEYLKRNNIHPAGNKKLYLKSILQILSSIVIYTVLVFFTPGIFLSVVLCIVLGLNLAIIGFNVMHEGGHHAYSRYKWLNEVSAYSLNVLGGVTYFWRIKHNVNHHTFTNVEGIDSDIDVKPFMRLHADQPWRPYHRYQHIYGVPLYGLSYIAWIFYEDFAKYFKNRVVIGNEEKRIPLKEHVIFWFTKLMYVLMYMVVPIVMVGFLPWLVGFLVITVICGIATSLVFQLAHVVEGTQFHLPENNEKQEWGVHQVLSTANFGTRSKTLHWLLGGLNFQIEHHLFPRISHVHYPQISLLVKEACRKSGIAYNEYRSMFRAIASHLFYLRQLGRAH